ncbi:MAG: hypothetical protein F7B17_02150 [Desulfurococcales archaeon]|nr:hypothetical protein [Desulfurococcales archaeon]
MKSVNLDPLADLENFIKDYVRGKAVLPRDERERRALEAKLNLLPGHLDRLAAFVRGGDTRMEWVGDYLVIIDRKVGSLCFIEVFWSIATTFERRDRNLVLSIDPSSIFKVHLSCHSSVFGLVAGLDYDSGKAFIHALPAPQASILSLVDGGLSEDLVRLAMGFHFHRWEPWAWQPSEGVRVRLQGDVVAEYAAVFGKVIDAIEAARSYKAFQSAVGDSVNKALEAVRNLIANLEESVEKTGESNIVGAVRAWLEENKGAFIPPSIVARSNLVRATRFAGHRESSWAPLRVIVDFGWDAGRRRRNVPLDAVKRCRLSSWKLLRGSFECALIALREAVGLLDLNVPLSSPGRPIILSVQGLLNLAAGIAAEGSHISDALLQPGKIEARVGDHVIVAEEGVVVEAPEAVLLHTLARGLDAVEKLDGEELSKVTLQGNRRLSPNSALALLEALALDTSSHIIVLTRPQRLTLSHREHGRATMEVEAPAAIILGSLKTADVLRLRMEGRRTGRS